MEVLPEKKPMAAGHSKQRSNFFMRCIDLLKTSSIIWMMRNTATHLKLAEDVTEENSSYGDSTTKQTTIKDLPEDVTVEILMRLPVESICCVQCVSKTTFDIARSPDFAAMHNLRFLDSAMSSLMRVSTCRNDKGKVVGQAWQSFKYNGSEKTLVESRHVSQIFFKDILDHVDFAFCNLFFVKSWSGSPCMLINPLKDEVLQLPISNIQAPTTDYSGDADWYGMGFDNLTSTYKIVHVSANKKHNCVVAQVLVLGTSSWRQIHLAPSFDVSPLFSGKRDKNGIYVAGDMHWLIYRTRESPGHIISFNFNREEFYATLPPTGHVFHEYARLLKFRGCLALAEVNRNEDNIKIWMLKTYKDEKKWELHHNVRINRFDYPGINGEWSQWTSAEWEHGICFISHNEGYFFDLRHLQKVKVKLPQRNFFSIFSVENLRTSISYSIFSCTDSLISLRNYGELKDCNKRQTTLDSSLKRKLFEFVIYFLCSLIYSLLKEYFK